jgi:hypothetical protein
VLIIWRSVVLIQYLVQSICVSRRPVCWSSSSCSTCIPDGHLQWVTIPDAVLIHLTSWWWARVCSKHVEDWNKCVIKKITVRQVCHLLKVTHMYFLPRRNSPSGLRPTHCLGFMTILGTTPLDEWPARRRDLYLTTHNTHKRERERETSMQPAGFEPTIPASKRPQTQARSLGLASHTYIYRNL